jgi:hypothetical protein
MRSFHDVFRLFHALSQKKLEERLTAIPARRNIVGVEELSSKKLSLQKQNIYLKT